MSPPVSEDTGDVIPYDVLRPAADTPSTAPLSSPSVTFPPSPTPTLATSQPPCAPRTEHANHPRRRSSRLADKGGRVNQIVPPSTDIDDEGDAGEKPILNRDVSCYDITAYYYELVSLELNLNLIKDVTLSPSFFTSIVPGLLGSLAKQ